MPPKRKLFSKTPKNGTIFSVLLDKFFVLFYKGKLKKILAAYKRFFLSKQDFIALKDGLRSLVLLSKQDALAKEILDAIHGDVMKGLEEYGGIPEWKALDGDAKRDYVTRCIENLDGIFVEQKVGIRRRSWVGIRRVHTNNDD